jgi:1-acyl-sn-glycerol-3-phosphate acyltransferase
MAHRTTTTQRRAVSITSVALIIPVLVLTIPLWLPLAVAYDLVRGWRRLPSVRLGIFAIWWAGLECVGVIAAGMLWLVGAAQRREVHYRLQRWWAGQVLNAISSTVGLELDVDGVDLLSGGPIIVLSRHASLADSLVTAVVLTTRARMNPRMVLKKELEWDPCLDVVGHRLPNVFVDRSASDNAQAVEDLTALVADLSTSDAAVIFPEGTRASKSKRERALAAISERDPERGERLSALGWLIPPRPTGTVAMLEGAPTADVVFTWHAGLDGLDSFAGIHRGVASGPLQIRYVVERFDRADVPSPGPGAENAARFLRWLDDRWLEMDAAVGTALEAASMSSTAGSRDELPKASNP